MKTQIIIEFGRLVGGLIILPVLLLYLGLAAEPIARWLR